MEIIDRKEDIEQEDSYQPDLPQESQRLTLTEVNLQLYQEFLWYQTNLNIPTIHVNRNSALNDKRLSSKDAPPSYSFQQVFTFDNSVLVCKVLERKLLLSKKNIYHKNRVRHHTTSTSSASFERYNISQSDYLSSDFDLILQFPTKLVKDIICVEFEKGNPRLLIPSSIGIVYMVILKNLHVQEKSQELQVPTLELEVGSSFITQLVRTTEKGPLHEREGLTLAANCSTGAVHLFAVPQVFEDNYRRINSSFDFKLSRNMFDNLLSNILPIRNEKDSLVTLQYISHKILVGITRNNVLKVINLHKKGVIFEYKISSFDDLDEQNPDTNEICLKALAVNPLIQNEKINFLLLVCKLNSTVHKYVKFLNLSFQTTHNKRNIINLYEVPTSADLGVNCNVSLLATYDTQNSITSIDVNHYGLAISSYDETECNSEVHHMRFSQGRPEISTSLFSETTKILSFDDRRSNLIASAISPEDVCDILQNNHELIHVDAIAQALKDFGHSIDQSIFNLRPLEKRSSLIDILRGSYESGFIKDVGILKFFQECFLRSKEMTKVEGVFLSKEQDFAPVILRNRVVSLAIKRDKIESLDLMNKINARKEMGYEIFNAIDIDNPEYFGNFLLLLSFFKKHTASYTGFLQDYFEKDFDNLPALIDKVLFEIELDFNNEDRTRFFLLLEDLIASGSQLSKWCEQFISLFQKSLDGNGDDPLSNLHLIDNIDVWGFSTIELLCGISRQRIRHYLDISLDFLLMVKFINASQVVPEDQKVGHWELRPLYDYIQSMMSFTILMSYTPQLFNLNKIEHKDLSEVIYNLNNIDTFTYFVIFEYKKYLGNASGYHLVEPQEWINKVCARLIRKISFEPRYDRMDEIPEIAGFLLKFKEYESALMVIDKMFYKNPALEYAKTESLYHLDRIGDMMSSLFYVASYVNLESFRTSGSLNKASIYNNYWHKKEKEYLKSVTERITTSLSSALSNFLLNSMKYSFFASQSITSGIASTALYLQDVDDNALALFVREIIEIHQKSKDFDAVYNFLSLFPREHSEHKKEYVNIFRKVINELVLSNQFRKLLEFPLDSETYEIVAVYLEEYLKSECERMLADFESTLHKPEEIYTKFEKSYSIYHKVIAFFLEKELHKQAGYIMIRFYECLSILDSSFKNLDRPEYLKVLKARLSLLNEAIFSLDVSEDLYGYIIQKPKEEKPNGKRTYLARSNANLPKAEVLTWIFSQSNNYELKDVVHTGEEFLDSEFSEEDFIILTKDKLTRHKELLSARIILEEKDALSLQERGYLLPANISRVGKYLIATAEFDKAVDFMLAFRFTIAEAIPFMVYTYFFNLSDVISDTRFYEGLRRVSSLVESYNGVYVREVIAEALLKFSEEKYKYSINLPSFLVDEFRDKDPVRLTRIYLDFGLYQEAVRTLVKAIEKNRKLLNERELGVNEDITKQAHYIDQNVFLEVVNYLNSFKDEESEYAKTHLERLFAAVEGAFQV